MANLRLTLDTAALVANWRELAALGGVATGAAVKADGYGLGAPAVVAALAAAGACDFFVASWDEAAALGEMPPGTRLAVLHGVQGGEMATALASGGGAGAQHAGTGRGVARRRRPGGRATSWSIPGSTGSG